MSDTPPEANPEAPMFDVDGEPSVLGVSDTVEFTRARRKELKAQRKEAKRLHKAAIYENTDDDIVFIYEPHVRYVPPLRPYARDLWTRRAFAVELARSKLKGKRSNTVLGGLWALIDPLFMVCLYYFLFSVLRGGQRPSEFIPVIISGILHFQVSAAALNEGGNSVSSQSGLMLNSTFPRMLLPISAIYGGFLKFLPSIPIILTATLVLDAEIGVNTFWWLALFPLQVIIGLGLALLISTLVVFYADMKNLLTYISRIVFFTSPVIWPADLPSDAIISVVRWMPFFGVFANYQAILGGESPDMTLMAISVGWAIGSVILGSWLFLRFEREFATKL